MMDMDSFQLLYNQLKERHYNNFYQNAKQDSNYLKATIQENEFNEQSEKLNLSDEQRNVIVQWIDAIHAQKAAYIVVAFGMGRGRKNFCVYGEKSSLIRSRYV